MVPLEAEVLSPDVLAGLTRDQIAALPIHLGKNVRRLDEFFAVEGEKSEHVRIVGDAGKVKWIGRHMSRGTLTIDGNAGMHLGSGMSGGAIEVTGNASDWLGAEMRGGFIRVRGNAGGQIGAAYRGTLVGMSGGAIIVDGYAGLEVGMRMKRGIIVVASGVRDFAGLEMGGGTIVLGGAEQRTGAWMRRGTIIALTPVPVLPTFSYAASYNPGFLSLYSAHLARFGIELPFAETAGVYRRYTGDAAIPGKGELLIWEPNGTK